MTNLNIKLLKSNHKSGKNRWMDGCEDMELEPGIRLRHDSGKVMIETDPDIEAHISNKRIVMMQYLPCGEVLQTPEGSYFWLNQGLALQKKDKLCPEKRRLRFELIRQSWPIPETPLEESQESGKESSKEEAAQNLDSDSGQQSPRKTRIRSLTMMMAPLVIGSLLGGLAVSSFQDSSPLKSKPAASPPPSPQPVGKHVETRQPAESIDITQENSAHEEEPLSEQGLPAPDSTGLLDDSTKVSQPKKPVETKKLKKSRPTPIDCRRHKNILCEFLTTPTHHKIAANRISKIAHGIAKNRRSIIGFDGERVPVKWVRSRFHDLIKEQWPRFFNRKDGSRRQFHFMMRRHPQLLTKSLKSQLATLESGLRRQYDQIALIRRGDPELGRKRLEELNKLLPSNFILKKVVKKDLSEYYN